MPASVATLFHPKQKKGELAKQPVNSRPLAKRSPAPPKPSPPTLTPTPSTPEPTPAGSAPSLPDGPYTEFKLVSSAVNGWKYDVMRFDSRKPVDILSWERPVKLNRKDTRKVQPGDEEEQPVQVAIKPMLGPDGKPVIGADGRMVMLDAEGKPIHNNANNGKQKGGGRKKMQKKTKQIFKVADSVRQLRKEERYQWVMEDESGSEYWTAMIEDTNKAMTHAFFMPASNNTFKFVPAHRWYKFQKKGKHNIPSLEEAEKLMSTITRNKDPSRWLLRNNRQASESTVALLKQEGDAGASDMPRSLGPGGRRLRVKQEDDLFGDDDEEGRRRPRNEMDADFDEVPYEEEFQDDDEKIDLYEDELEKEMEERLKKEYMSANKEGEAGVDADSDEDEPKKATGGEKSMKKLVNRHERNEAYDSDEEANPYVSEEDESESEEEIVTNEPAVKQQPTPTPSRAASQPPNPAQQASSSTPRPPTSGSTPGSRATSPTPAAPVQAGHALVAKRATSPKVPKPKPVGTGASRASSPLAQDAHALSPSARTATSPPPGQPSSSQKRKAEDDGDAMPTPATPNGDATRPPKKRKPAPRAVDGNGNPIPLTDQMVIDWLATTDGATTRDCITHFTPFLRAKEDKEGFTKLIKEVASLKGGVLTLRPHFRARATPATSPPPAPVVKMDTSA